MGKIRELITKDTSHDNESKRLTVIIRTLVLYFIVFFIVSLVYDVTQGYFFLTYTVKISIIVAFIAVLIASYRFSKITTLWIFILAMISWIYYTVVFYGWTIGAQNYLILLVVLFYFSNYGYYSRKIAFSLIIFLVYLLFHYISNNNGTYVVMGEVQLSLMSDINIGMFLWCLSTVVYEFSKDSQELENKLIEYNRRLKEQANTDTLTGLPNRRQALEYLEGRTKGLQSFSVCICDIDFFKKVNDTYGHDFGDEALKQLAACLKGETRDKFFVARWGGEEFLLVFPNCNGDDAFVHLVSIQNAVRRMVITRGKTEIQITMTFGLTEYDTNQPLGETLKEADDKLYLGKEQGRDIIIY